MNRTKRCTQRYGEGENGKRRKQIRRGVLRTDHHRTTTSVSMATTDVAVGRLFSRPSPAARSDSSIVYAGCSSCLQRRLWTLLLQWVCSAASVSKYLRSVEGGAVVVGCV